MTDDRLTERYRAFLAELSAVTAAILEGTGSVASAGEPPKGGWIVTLKASDGAHGTIRVAVDREGARTLSKRATGSDVEPEEPAVVQTLTEVFGQSSTAYLQRLSLIGARLTVGSVQPDAEGVGADASTFVLTVGDWRMRVAIDGDIDGDATAEPVVSNGPTLDVILDIDLPLVVRFGRTEMSLKALTGLGPGSVIDLERAPDDPVEVFVSNQLVARGEVVIVGGSYGVRITEVRDAAERVRSMEVEW